MTLEAAWAEYEARNEYVNRVARAEQPICGAIIPPTKIRAHQAECPVCRPLCYPNGRVA